MMANNVIPFGGAPQQQQIHPEDPRTQIALLHVSADQLALALLAAPAGPMGVLEFAGAMLERLTMLQLDPLAAAKVTAQVTRPLDAARDGLAAIRRVMETGLVLANGPLPPPPKAG
jgi:hypothetical protein